jgi:hypothetical protein
MVRVLGWLVLLGRSQASKDEPATANPSRYPGVNGTETYSDGLDIGYKWYDANGLTPLYPFGYGLSYTSFAYGNIKVTPHVFNGAAARTRTPTRTRSSPRFRRRCRTPAPESAAMSRSCT